MRWRDVLFRKFGPGAFSGVTLRTWLQILRDNHFSIDLAYWPRALLITLGAFPNTLSAAAEELRYGRAIARTKVERPLFVLGTFRSGTTHLHNLLAADKRFAYPNLYQVTCPRGFLSSEHAASWLISWCLPHARPMDAVKFGINEPQEEDFAICALSGQASPMSMAFPRNVTFYDRFYTLADLSPEELARWRASHELFLKKLTYKFGRPLVLKSPANMARIFALLDLYPDARFVHIHRNPYHVFRSAKHTVAAAGPWWQLQRRDYHDDGTIERELIAQLKILYSAYFAQRSLIPEGRLCDIAFEDLDRNPLGQMKLVYESLGLPSFGDFEPHLAAYLQSIADYKKNVLAEPADPVRERLHCELKPCFEEWGYAA